MQKLKRISAIIVVVVIILCALLTLIFAILDMVGAGDFTAAWKASMWCMVVIPIFTYAVFLIARVLKRHNDESNSQENKEDAQ